SRNPEPDHGCSALQDKRTVKLRFALQVKSVLKRAGDNIGTAPDNGLQGARTACKIRDRHIQAFVFEKTLAFSHRQRQVIRECLAAYSDMHLLTLKCLST